MTRHIEVKFVLDLMEDTDPVIVSSAAQVLEMVTTAAAEGALTGLMTSLDKPNMTSEERSVAVYQQACIRMAHRMGIMDLKDDPAPTPLLPRKGRVLDL